MTRDVFIPASAIFYVRGALANAIQRTEMDLEFARKALEDPDAPPIGLEMARFIIARDSQWLKEAKEEFAKLPEEIRPWMR